MCPEQGTEGQAADLMWGAATEAGNGAGAEQQQGPAHGQEQCPQAGPVGRGCPLPVTPPTPVPADGWGGMKADLGRG